MRSFFFRFKMAASMCRCVSASPRTFSRFILQNVGQSIRCAYSTVEVSTEHPVDIPQARYPPIVPPLVGKSKETIEYRTQLAIQDMNDKPTAKEMIHELSKVQSWHYTLHTACFHYSFLDLYKHSTKTIMVEDLPKRIQDLTNSPEVEQVVEKLKPHIMDCILQEQLYVYRHRGDTVKRDFTAGRQTMENVMRILLTGLAADFPHLRDGEIDQDVQVTSFWKRDDTRFKFKGKPLFLIRTKDPLPEFISKDDELSVGEVPSWSYAPENVSVFKKHVNPICFPGYKLGNPYNCGHTQIYMTKFNRARCIEKNILGEVLQGFGLSSSFGWLNGLALYNMYNPYRDIKQPMICQTVVTDGCNFSFFSYQLNTLGLCSRSAGNPLRNVCWYTQDMELYGEVHDGRVRDFNVDVLKHIVAFLLSPTVPLED